MVLKYLLVLLSDSSVSFCYEPTHAKEKHDLISLENLKKTVVFAIKNNLKVNFLLPDITLDASYYACMEEIGHVKIVPFHSHPITDDTIYVIDSKRFPKSEELVNFTQQNFIVKLHKKHLKKWAAFLKILLPCSARINLVLMDLEHYDESDYTVYEKQLEKISNDLIHSQSQNTVPELNFLTDRMDLDQMNNCQAGLQHITVAPNGKMYLCPAFYHEDPSDDLGEIRTDIDIKNARLLELKYAPICRVCDAFHCKRCVYLNKKLTNEINTPSSQQCITAHIERDASRKLLEKLQKIHTQFKWDKSIPQLDYRDPFEIVKGNPQKISEINLTFQK